MLAKLGSWPTAGLRPPGNKPDSALGTVQSQEETDDETAGNKSGRIPDVSAVETEQAKAIVLPAQARLDFRKLLHSSQFTVRIVARA